MALGAKPCAAAVVLVSEFESEREPELETDSDPNSGRELETERESEPAVPLLGWVVFAGRIAAASKACFIGSKARVHESRLSLSYLQ